MRKAGQIPAKLRNLDTDASWSMSGYYSWVYGYRLHMTCNENAFPVMVQVETAAVSESQVLDQKEALILNQLSPQTPAHKWLHGRFAQAYHHFIKSPDMIAHLRKRRTSVEPLFDLIAKIIGTQAQQKQLSVQHLA